MVLGFGSASRIGRGMFRTTAISALLAAIATPALAADEDTQLWVTAATAVPLAEDVSGNFEVSYRFREGGDQMLTRGAVDFRLSKAVTVAGGAAWVDFAGGHEFRPHQQLTFTTGPLAFRTRVEERFIAGADRMQLRLRQRVQLTQPLSSEARLSGTAELLYIARTENPAAKARVDSWRFGVAASHRLSPHFEAQLGYLLIYAPRSGAPDRVSHVPQLTLTFRP
jgi:hypothetical protein